ncbi:4a-hydroxytetrahydrobiopterin dehydratase [Pseudonocardia endophytica]|uniref:Putative pterin-4-alpha-carbinolamine dehydratase n=1 Tax=Pseudonocardia endophytica TaxID=401976 RepID=A0A4R1I8N9_PSEEN|nr:4a-hydroxytetrahydrobiopterin dehydratase [Pseudonocardia endophytica]TCK26542.1 4a-hydroxytetrahydrobiopterin dehydratase [Pseudonocardia endophytica]
MAESKALLDDDSIASALADLTGWERDGDSIVTYAKLDDFVTAIGVVDKVAEDAESVQHHPDIDIRYNSLKFKLSTHSEGGLTAKDTDFAARINQRVSDAGGSTQSRA